MAKVSKNQRTTRGDKSSIKMAKIVVAQKKDNGQYRFRDKMVLAEAVQDELKAARA
jgi:hypothetical protein